jgi:prepilin-type N-terminal cleavage/methylation domain-containing protein
MLKYLLARVREAHAEELEGEGAFEGGFTLIELMVVLLIIAILLAIAIPTFLGVTGSAKDRAAQSTLTNVVTETVAAYQNTQAFPSIPAAAATQCTAPVTSCTDAPASYSANDPQFNWFNGANSNDVCTVAGTIFAASKCVSVLPVDVAAASDLQGVVLAVMSPTGTCWWAANLQANPQAIAADSSAFIKASGAGTAGTYYANKTNAGAHCYAGYALSGSGLKWGTSYADPAGVN